MTDQYTTAEAAAAVAWARQWVGRAAYRDHCLALVRGAWGAPGLGGTAADAAARAQKAGALHSDGSPPPIGVPVFFTGGSHGAGHVALVSKYVNGEPYVITNDYPQMGTVGEVPLSELEHAWGHLKYAGWSTNINHKNISVATTAPQGAVTVDPAGGTSVSGVNSTGTQDVFDYLQSQFGLTDSLLSLDKTDPKKGFTLREAFDQIRQQKIVDPVRAANILAQTDWFKTHGVDVTKRLTQEATNSGEFKQQVNATYSQLKDSLAAEGVKLSDADLRALARDSYVYGFNQSQILDSALGRKSAGATGGGAIGGQLDALDGLAYANGVTLSAQDRNAWWRDLANGNKTQGDFENVIRQNAAQTYSVFKDQIMAGQNLSDLIKPYRQVASQLLEVPEGNLGWDDPLFKDGKAFTSTDAKSGQPMVKPLWQFRQDIQNDKRWAYTDNAKQQASDFGLKVLQRFGMAA